MSDILSAVLLCLAAVLAGAHGAPLSGPAAIAGSVDVKIAGQPSTPVVHKRSFVFVASSSAKATLLTSSGGNDAGLPPCEIGLPDHVSEELGASVSHAMPRDGAGHGYDACGPPALI